MILIWTFKTHVRTTHTHHTHIKRERERESSFEVLYYTLYSVCWLTWTTFSHGTSDAQHSDLPASCQPSTHTRTHTVSHSLNNTLQGYTLGKKDSDMVFFYNRQALKLCFFVLRLSVHVFDKPTKMLMLTTVSFPDSLPREPKITHIFSQNCALIAVYYLPHIFPLQTVTTFTVKPWPSTNVFTLMQVERLLFWQHIFLFSCHYKLKL